MTSSMLDDGADGCDARTDGVRAGVRLEGRALAGPRLDTGEDRVDLGAFDGRAGRCVARPEREGRRDSELTNHLPSIGPEHTARSEP